jgi:hypothetical protein
MSSLTWALGGAGGGFLVRGSWFCGWGDFDNPLETADERSNAVSEICVMMVITTHKQCT